MNKTYTCARVTILLFNEASFTVGTSMSNHRKRHGVSPVPRYCLVLQSGWGRVKNLQAASGGIPNGDLRRSFRC